MSEGKPPGPLSLPLFISPVAHLRMPQKASGLAQLRIPMSMYPQMVWENNFNIEVPSDGVCLPGSVLDPEPYP